MRTLSVLSPLRRCTDPPSRRCRNNEGYVRYFSFLLVATGTNLASSEQTIEKLINGPTAKYNDIALFKWQKILDVFNAYEQPIPTKSWLASTRGELEEIFANEEFAKAVRQSLPACFLPNDR